MKYLLPLLLLGCVACSSTRRFRFSPSPAEVRIEPQEGTLVARTLITVLQGEPGDPPRMLLRLLIENVDETPVRLDPTSLQLVTSDLTAFGAVEVDPADTEVPPGEQRTFDLRFVYPEHLPLSAQDLEGLHLHWRMDYAEGTADVSTTFQRTRDRVRYVSYPTVNWGLSCGYYGFRGAGPW